MARSTNEDIKRIHVTIIEKNTTVSMDETLYELLKDRLKSVNRLSVRQWIQDQINSMIEDKSLSDTTRSSSVSRRIQARAIRFIVTGSATTNTSSSSSDG